MAKTIICCIILICSAFAVRGQTECSYRIDTLAILEDRNLPEFIKQISSDCFTAYNNKRHIPTSWQRQLDCLTDGFDLANPGEDFRNGCTGPETLPSRRLDLLLTSDNLMVLTYELGQGAAGVIGVIMFCKFSENKLTDLWTCFTWDRLHSKEEIIDYLKDTEANKFMRHSNFLYF